MKKRLREMTWDDYGISRYRREELKAFCLQYEEKKAKIRYGLKGVAQDGQPHGNGTGKPTEAAAIGNSAYKKDCEMIEQAAIAAGAEIYPYIIKSVTNNLTYEDIEYDGKLGRIIVGRTEFYARRRLFYHFLDEIKSGYKIDLLS